MNLYDQPGFPIRNWESLRARDLPEATRWTRVEATPRLQLLPVSKPLTTLGVEGLPQHSTYLRARRTLGSEPGQVGGGPGAYLAEDSEAWFRVQLRLFQFHHSYPAVFIQVFFVIVITQAQWVHLGNKRGESFSGQAADLRGSRSACLRRHSQKQPPNCKAYGGGECVFQPSGNSISAQ